MGLNAIGRGLLTVEDSTLYGGSLINFRSDYGSTWEGDVVIRNCRWIPNAGNSSRPQIIHTSNDGMHDFGYPCSMPRQITVDGLFVDDSNHPKDYNGPYFLSDPDGGKDLKNTTRPFPYQPCQTLRVKRLTTATKKPLQISPNPHLAKTVVLIQGQ